MNNVTCQIEEDKKWAVSYFYYKERAGWHRAVHKRGGNVYENIDDTLKSISSSSVMYLVKVSNDPAGFFVKYENTEGMVALEGFHVIKNYRTVEFLPLFWKLLKRELGKEFVVGIYEKNTRAINHLLKQGFRLQNKIEEQNKIFYILKLKQ